MSTSKFERLIDLIINEDQERAEALFHDIVVEKSRQIYESLMDEDMSGSLVDEVEMEEEGMEGMLEDSEEDMDMGDEDMEDMGDEDMGDEDMGDEDMEDMGDEDMGDEDMGSAEPATKGDIMNLEDKLDQLMAEFESEFSAGDEDMGDEDMGDEDMEAMGDEEVDLDEVAPAGQQMATSNLAKIVRGVVGRNAAIYSEKLNNGGRSIKVNYGHDEAQMDEVKAALEAAGYKAEKVKTFSRLAGSTTRYPAFRLHVVKEASADEVMEAVEMKKVAQPKGEDHKAKSPVAANAGGKGPIGQVVKPVMSKGDESAPSSPRGPSNEYSKGQTTSSTKYKNAPGGSKIGDGKGESAPKPVTAQASGVNTKDIVPESRQAKKKILK